MATETRQKGSDSPSLAGIDPYRLSARQFRKMIDAGIFPEGANVELIDGLPAVKDADKPVPTFDGVPLYRLTIKQVYQMVDAHIIPESARLELLGGLLATKMTSYPPHIRAVDLLVRILRARVEPEYVVRQETVVRFKRRWLPEPDVAVARGPLARYDERLPTEADLVLLIEVADSSQAKDRGAKRHGYASADIPAYWVVDLAKRIVEVHSFPSKRTGKYRETVSYGEEKEVPVVIEGREFGVIAIKNLFPMKP